MLVENEKYLWIIRQIQKPRVTVTKGHFFIKVVLKILGMVQKSKGIY